MFLGTVNGKINRRKGKGYVAHNFLIVKNKRHPASGRSGFETIWNFGTIRDYDFSKKATAFWREVELVLDDFVAKGRIYRNDADKIRNQFRRYIDLPTVVAPATRPKVTADSSIAERVSGKVGNLL